MHREVLYGILGFIIFGIVGILVAQPLFSGSVLVVGATALTGTILSIFAARWMNTAGEARLERLSAKPTMMYSLRGAVIGLGVGILGSMWPLDTIDPTDRYAVLYIVGTGLCVAVGAYWATYLAHRYKLPAATPPVYRTLSDVVTMSDEKEDIREEQADT